MAMEETVSTLEMLCHAACTFGTHQWHLVCATCLSCGRASAPLIRMTHLRLGSAYDVGSLKAWTALHCLALYAEKLPVCAHLATTLALLPHFSSHHKSSLARTRRTRSNVASGCNSFLRMTMIYSQASSCHLSGRSRRLLQSYEETANVTCSWAARGCRSEVIEAAITSALASHTCTLFSVAWRLRSFMQS